MPLDLIEGAARLGECTTSWRHERRATRGDARSRHKSAAIVDLQHAGRAQRGDHFHPLAISFLFACLLAATLSPAAWALDESQQNFDTTTTATTTTTTTTSQEAEPSKQQQAPASSQRQAHQLAPATLISGVRQKRPLSIDEESRAGGFIMRALAAAASGRPTSVEAETTTTTTVQDQALADTTTHISLPTSEDGAPTGAPTSSNGNHDHEHDDEAEGRIPIDAKRKMFATHDQLNQLNASTKDEPINLGVNGNGGIGDGQQQTSRTGMGRLAYASSFLSDFLFRPRVQPSGALATSPSAPTLAPSTSTTSTTPSSVQHSEQPDELSCPGVCLNILSASIRCQRPVQNAFCPIFHKCCELDSSMVSVDHQPALTNAERIGSKVSDAKPTESPAIQSLAFNGTPVETSAPLAADQQAQSDQQQAPTGNQGQVGAALNSTVSRQVAHGATGSVYFLSSASDSDLDTEASAEQQRQQQQQQHPTLSSEASSTSVKDESAIQPANNKQHVPPASASQSFDTPASTKPTELPAASKSQGNRLVALQLANGTTAYLIQDAATTSRPRPIYANWTDYQMLMQMHQASNRNNQMQQQQQQSVVYHSNIDPVRKLTSSNEQQVASRTQVNLSSSAPTNPNDHTMTVTLSTDLRPTNEANSDSSHSAASNVPPTTDVRVLKDQHSAPYLPKSQQAATNPTLTTTTTTTTSTTTTTTIAPTTSEQSTLGTGAQEMPAISGVEEQPTDGAQAASAAPAYQMPALSATGIASLLGSLIDSFMPSATPSGPTSSSGPVVETSDTQLASMPGADLATGADGPAPSFMAPNSMGEQHNDRRYGLDLSFRQQQNEFNDTKFGGPMMTSDGGREAVSGAGGGEQRCLGYCALDQFLHLCDSYYVASDCSRAQKCCISSGATVPALDQQQAQQSSQPVQYQACRGTCLPIYHSSLCTKPNELLETPQVSDAMAASAAGACLPNQVCCAPPPPSADTALSGTADDNDETSNHIELTLPDSGAAQAARAPFSSSQSSSPMNSDQEANGSRENGPLAASLVPPPPPTLVNEANGLARPTQRTQAPLVTQRPGVLAKTAAPSFATNTAAGANSATSGSGGGFVNQILSMFKSNNPGKQRTRPPTNVAATQLVAPNTLYIPQQLQPMANYDPMLHLAMSASGPRPQQVAAPVQAQHAKQQTLFQATPPNIAMNNQQSVGIAASPSQPFVYHVYEQQPMVVGQQRWPTNPGLTGSGAAVVRPSEQQQQQPGQYQANNQQLDQQMLILQKQMQQQYAAMMAAAQNPRPTQQQPQQQPQSFQVAHPFLQPNNLPLDLQQPINYNAAAMQQTGGQQRPAVYQQQFASQQPQPARWQQSQKPKGGHQDNYAQASAINRLANGQPNRPASSQLAPAYNTNALSPFSAADASATLPHFNSASQSSPSFSAHRGNSQKVDRFQQQQQQGWQQLGDGNVGNSQITLNGQQQQQQHSRQPNKQAASPPEAGDTNVVAAGSWRQRQQQIAAASNNPLREQQQSLSSNLSPIISANGAGSSGGGELNRWPALAPASMPQQTAHVVRPTTTATSPAPVFVDTSSGDDEEPNLLGTETDSNAATSLSSTAASSDEDESVSSPGAQNNKPAEHTKPDCPFTCMAPLLSFNCAKPHYVDSSFACPSPGAICCVKSSGLNGQASNRFESTQLSSTPDLATSSVTATTAVESQWLTTTAPSISDGTSDDEEAADEQAAPVANSTAAEVTASGSFKNKAAISCGIPGGARAAKRSGQRVTSGRARARVTGGTDAQPGQWCWQAALMNGKNEYLCGGALIGSKWVLTAAHCVTQHLRSESQLYVRLGQWNLNSSSLAERRTARNLPVKTSYVHHNHNGITLDNDIALLRLEHSALPTSSDQTGAEYESICTICLPERAGGGSSGAGAAPPLEPGRRCTVTGYGYERESGPAALRVRQTELPIVSDSECQNKTSLVLGKPFVLPASSFCAGGELGQDACHGDGGSPLSCQHSDGYYELTGIVSWGYKCGQRDLPGLYAKVSNFVGWINQIVSVNN